MLHKAWLTAKTSITLIVLLTFVLAAGAWGYKQAVTPIPKPPPVPCVVKNVGPNFTPDLAWLRIYNGTKTGGLAKNVVKLIFGNAGFHVLKVGNTEEPLAKTYVAGVSATSPEVVLVMSHFPKGTPFVADPKKYADHLVDIYLGADFKAASLNTAPLAKVALSDGKACVPQVTTVNSDS